jgi:hypothetical protein
VILIEDTIVSEELLNRHFVCNLNACKGACCIEGDRGAPLREDEIPLIEANLPAILPFLPEEQQLLIETSGFYEKDTDGELVTLCMPDRSCVFVVREGGILSCGMEKAFRAEASSFHKPISCHLYPVRVKTYKEFTAVNYHPWDICSPACAHGKDLGVPLYKFVENALVRRFGQEWMDALDATANHLDDDKQD